MILSTSISLPPNVQNQISSAAFRYSVDALVLSAIAQVMSAGQQFSPSNTLLVNEIGGVGVMGISPDIASSLGYDASDETQNILAGAAYMAALLGQFTGNYPFSVAAYYSGADTVVHWNGVPPLAQAQQFTYNVTTLARQAGSRSISTRTTLENQAGFDADAGTETQQLVTPFGQSVDPNDPTQANSAIPNLQINYGLDEAPWYSKTQDGSLVVGNPRIRQFAQPVSFIVYLNRSRDIFLRNPHDNQPIVLELNCSISTFELQSRHVYNRTPSRTGMHVTFWGMQPDLINGSGSTGVFMNQFGITDFFSVANVTDDMKQLVINGFSHIFKSNFSAAPQTSTGELINFSPEQTGTNVQSEIDQSFNTIVKKRSVDPNSAFRVAAQDAFVEFLKLFQMNGNVWFFNPNYKGSYTGQDQQGPNAWSESTGATSFEQVARNNDVMTRGFVAMKYKNNVYLGYFKSLSWSQDAEKPFSWNFNFTFQVERTYSALYWPNLGVTQLANQAGAIISGAVRERPGPVETTPSAIEGTIE